MAGKGFSHTPNTGEFKNYTSWGRTRSPKNILSSHRAGTNANGDGLAVNTDTSDPFTTENQRFRQRCSLF